MSVLSRSYPNIEVNGSIDESRYCYIESRVHGLFACLYCIIYGFYICKTENLKGVVKLGNDHLYYNDEIGKNIYEYFFEQQAMLFPQKSTGRPAFQYNRGLLALL